MFVVDKLQDLLIFIHEIHSARIVNHPIHVQDQETANKAYVYRCVVWVSFRP